MNNLPPQFMRMFKGGNPQKAALDILQQNAKGNPIIENAIGMAQGNNFAGIEDLVRNICKSKGLNADELMNNLQNQFK